MKSKGEKNLLFSCIITNTHVEDKLLEEPQGTVEAQDGAAPGGGSVFRTFQ